MSVTEVGSHKAAPYDFTMKKEEPEEDLAAAFSRLVQERREEFYEKVRTGTTEPSYQIGAGSYTEKQWARLLKGFDAAEDALRKAAGLKKRRKPSETNWKKKPIQEDKTSADRELSMLLTECTSCTYPSMEEGEEDVCYFTVYSPDGIYCRKKGKSGYEWSIEFEEASQFEKVMAFINSMDDRENLGFACHENFWWDFLEDKINLEEFQDFLDTSAANGMPEYLLFTEDGHLVNSEAARYARYTFPPFANLIATTSEEFLQWQEETIQQEWNAFWAKLYEENPQFVGQQLVYDCFLGSWRLANEMEKRMARDAEEAFATYNQVHNH